jgi:hypothetical protein
MRKIGYLDEWEIGQRELIRQRQIPGSGGIDPDIYTIKFMEGRTLKFKKADWNPWNSWYCFGAEPEIRAKFWYPNIKTGDNVIDAGASWGPYTITAGLLGANVTAFEPDTRIFPALLDNIQLNGLQVATYNIGLSDEKKVVDWDELKGMSLVNLDEIYNQKLDFIKIDVEGQELEVLRGASETIKKSKPKILLEAHIGYGPSLLNDAAEIIFKMKEGYELIIYDSIPSRDTIHALFY